MAFSTSKLLPFLLHFRSRTIPCWLLIFLITTQLFDHHGLDFHLQFLVDIFLNKTFSPLKVLLVSIPLLFPIFDEWIRYKHFDLPLQNNVEGITSISTVHNIVIHVHCLQFKCVDQLLHIFILKIPLLEEFDGLQYAGNLFDFLLCPLIKWFCQNCLHK